MMMARGFVRTTWHYIGYIYKGGLSVRVECTPRLNAIASSGMEVEEERRGEALPN